ncbi:17061_t:CDS:1, partial [Dentiscutata erythropus]
DYILKEVAKLFRGLIQLECIFARYDRDEFVILFKDTSIEQAFEFAEKIKTSVEEYSFNYKRTKLKATLSIRVSGINFSVNTYNDLLNYADISSKK